MGRILEQGDRRTMRKVKAFRRFLVIPDTHIGDAVMMQSALLAVRDFFPDAEVDYVTNKVVAPLIEGNPDVNRVIPLYSNRQFPTPAEVGAIRNIVRGGRYDLCFNICPFLGTREIAEPGQLVARFMNRAPTIIRNEDDPSKINHFSYHGYQFVRELLLRVAQPGRESHFQGVRTTYSDEAIDRAWRFAEEADLSPHSQVLMINPDSSSKFNLMPFESQAGLLALLVRETAADTTILLGSGHSEAGIGERLMETIPYPYRSRIRIVPRSMPLDVYSAVIDFADVFISGDTGPMHLAAARRYSRSGRYQFRNRTAVLSIFGATMPRMSGYDSIQPGYIPANQDAPSWCYLAGSPCRNITCLNKMFKTCGTVRCFEQVDLKGLSVIVGSYLKGLIRHEPSRLAHYH
jgi:ADP-heptose:LPS heptosyltransferase